MLMHRNAVTTQLSEIKEKHNISRDIQSNYSTFLEVLHDLKTFIFFKLRWCGHI